MASNQIGPFILETQVTMPNISFGSIHISPHKVVFLDDRDPRTTISGFDPLHTKAEQGIAIEPRTLSDIFGRQHSNPSDRKLKEDLSQMASGVLEDASKVHGFTRDTRDSRAFGHNPFTVSADHVDLDFVQTKPDEPRKAIITPRLDISLPPQ